LRCKPFFCKGEAIHLVGEGFFSKSGFSLEGVNTTLEGLFQEKNLGQILLFQTQVVVLSLKLISVCIREIIQLDDQHGEARFKHLLLHRLVALLVILLQHVERLTQRLRG